MKIRKRGDFDAVWFSATFKRIKNGMYFFFTGEEKVDFPTITIRKTVYKNFHKWKYRRTILKNLLKKKKISLMTEYWWAKYWRKGKTLRTLLEELKNEPELVHGYSMTNKERYDQVLNALDQADEYYSKFDLLFTNVDPMLGFRCDSFKDFVKEKKEKITYRPIPNKYISYFK